MIHEDPDDLGYFTDSMSNWTRIWEEYTGVRAPTKQWDPAPPSGQSATIPHVDLSEDEQAHIEEAARRQHEGREIAAEASRDRAGYAGLFDASGKIV